MLRDADRREQKTTQRASRTKNPQNLKPILHAAPGHHPHHVPLVRARRHRLRLRLRCHDRGSRAFDPKGHTFPTGKTEILPILDGGGDDGDNASESTCSVVII